MMENTESHEINRYITGRSLTWDLFKVHNGDGARTCFERMCRKLFDRRFFDGKSLFISSPNNPGTEIEPVYCEKQQHTISFQSKFFSNSINYSQIDHSADETIKYYKDKLDIWYLYCNLDLSLDSTSYTNIVTKLKLANIEIYPITGETLLNEVQKYPDLIAEFFGSDIEWETYQETRKLREKLQQYFQEPENLIHNQNPGEMGKKQKITSTEAISSQPYIDPLFEKYMNEQMENYYRQGIPFRTPQLLASALKYPNNQALVILNFFNGCGDKLLKEIYEQDIRHIADSGKKFRDSQKKEFYAKIREGEERVNISKISPCIFCYYLITSGGATERKLKDMLGKDDYEYAKAWMLEERDLSID